MKRSELSAAIDRGLERLRKRLKRTYAGCYPDGHIEERVAELAGGKG